MLLLLNHTYQELLRLIDLRLLLIGICRSLFFKFFLFSVQETLLNFVKSMVLFVRLLFIWRSLCDLDLTFNNFLLYYRYFEMI